MGHCQKQRQKVRCERACARARVCVRACARGESKRDTFLGLSRSGYAMNATEEASQDQTRGLHRQLNLTPMCNKRQRADKETTHTGHTAQRKDES